jgi:hypothetical protein
MLARENPGTNIHPTAAAVPYSMPPSLSILFSSTSPCLEKTTSMHAAATMTPQNHPLDSLKAQFLKPFLARISLLRQ